MRVMKRLTALVLMMLIMVASTFTMAFAITTEEEAWLEKNIVAANDNGVTGKSSWLKNWLVTDPELSDSETAIFNIGEKQVYLAAGKTEEGLSKQINSSIKNAQTVDNVSGVTDGLNISADTTGAQAMLMGFSPIISLVLGIIVTLATMGMTVFSAFDICYIAFPVFRNKCEDAKTQGNGAMVKKDSNGGSSLRWVTDDAQYAIQQGSIESGKSPWTIYFKKRVMSYILLAIIIFILLTGNITLLTDIALKVVSGIMDVLGGLA